MALCDMFRDDFDLLLLLQVILIFKTNNIYKWSNNLRFSTDIFLVNEIYVG